jgi:hypothetical protein
MTNNVAHVLISYECIPQGELQTKSWFAMSIFDAIYSCNSMLHKTAFMTIYPQIKAKEPLQATLPITS